MIYNYFKFFYGILETVIRYKIINRSLFFGTHRQIFVYVFTCTYRKCMLDLVSALIYILIQTVQKTKLIELQ